MKNFDKLPKEYFVLIKKNMMGFSRKNLWANFIFLVAFGCVFNPGLAIDIPIVKFLLYIFLTIMLLWLIVCLYFSSKHTLICHKPAYIILNIVGLALFRITFLQMLALLSAVMYCNTWYYPDPIVVYIIYGASCLVLVEELVVNILSWKHTKKYIIAGEFKEDGNGFFGKYNERVKKFWEVVTSVSLIVMVLSLAFIPLGRALGNFGIYIDGHKWCVPIIGLYFTAYHVLLYIFAYINSKLLTQFYYIKRFEPCTPELKEDKEYGIGFAFARFILAVIIIIAIFIFAVKMGQTI